MIDLPEHWDRGRIKWDTKLEAGATPSTDEPTFWLDGDNPEGTPFVAISDMSRRTYVTNTAKSLSKEAIATRTMPMGTAGTLLLAMYASVGEVAFLDLRATWNQALLGIEPNHDRVDPRFLRYVLLDMRDDLLREVRSNTQANLNAGQIGNIWFQRPPLGEQRAIADFLDRETARIDTLIEEQQRLIDLLRERRSAVITNAATAGIDRAPLVDSGNVYLGSVPAHWVVSRFSREIDINTGQVDPQVEPWASMVLVAPNHIEAGTGRIVDRETAREQGAESGKYLASAGQLIYSKIRPSLNKVAIAEIDCLTSADMYAMSSKQGDDLRYVQYYMLAQPFHTFATQMSLRVKMPKINRDELGEAPYLRPPLDEQRRIVAFIDNQTARIDTLISEAQRFIELARERRSALITAAVTGQVDVWDEVG
ncbi:restriction endonuclease subunit S [Gordonia sp. VNK21]|uniref:restriction endonuclease subunit S n=1 Tax=Gordonia sp. VNK21 TaxID=3382483 RepID=UPI0038D4B444